jgi:hypothetical protein
VLPSPFFLCARPARILNSSAVCGNFTTIPWHLGQELATFTLHLPRISAEVPCGFSCQSAPLPRRRCLISTARGGAFVRGIRRGIENRGLPERLNGAAERARGTRSRSNSFLNGGHQGSLLPRKEPELNKRPLIYKTVHDRKVTVSDCRTSSPDLQKER